MRKKLLSAILAAAMSVSLFSCSGNATEEEITEQETTAETTAEITEETTETTETTAETTASEDENNEYEDVSVSETDEENQTAETGKQISVQKDLSVRSEVNSDEERNICTISLADLIGEGDRINSFTFAVESKNGENLGVLKGSYGIVVSDDCPSANSTGFYQTPDFETETDGSYAELTWNVPDEIADYVCADGEIMFGYWWGDADVITVKSVSCDFTHTAELQQ